jgi:pimeloyl-ACP methyl ester carboxylesterase
VRRVDATKWLAARAIIASLLAMGTLPLAAADPTQSGEAGCMTPQLRPGVPAEPDEHDAVSGVPVLFVHGMNGNPSSWQSLADRVAGDRWDSVWLFDYRAWSLDWVTDSHIGPALADAIDCLYRSSGHRVVVVDHSMGGLATQFAVSQRSSSGGLVTDEVAEVLTLGTPYQGSLLLSVLRGVAAPSLPIQAMLAACAGVVHVGRSHGLLESPCDTLAVANSPVGTALQYHSSEIANLPPWPNTLSVHDLAGQIEMQLLPRDLASADIGDGVVTTGSATAHNTEGPPSVVTCTLAPWQVVYPGHDPCWHGALMVNATLANSVVRHIEAALGQAANQAVVAPGRVGPLQAGMSLDRALATGWVKRVPPDMCDIQYVPPSWLHHMYPVLGYTGHDLGLVTIDEPGPHTERGIEVGSSITALKAAYGSRLVDLGPNIEISGHEYALFDSHGELDFADLENGRVDVMGVFSQTDPQHAQHVPSEGC